jgi:hypothetical protein
MSGDVVIREHIKHTNNTLIFGQLNGNADQGVPSLASAMIGQENFGEVIEKIYNVHSSQRLVVENIDDVMRIYKPTYYFRISQESVDGVLTNVAEHSLKKMPDALPVELSSESLCFKLMATDGKLHLDEMIAELRSSLEKARADYLAATKSRKPARMAQQQQMRSKLVSRLTEPVTTYLILAQSTLSYNTIEDESGPENSTSATSAGSHGTILLPEKVNGEWLLKRKRIRIATPDDIPADIEDDSDQYRILSDKFLQNKVREGKKLLASAVQGALKSIKDESSLTEVKKQLVDDLVAGGVAGELMIDDLTPEKSPSVNDVLTSAKDRYLADKSDLLIEDRASHDPKTQPRESEETAVSTEVRSERMLSRRIRERLDVDELNQCIRRIEQHALSFFRDDDGKQDKIAAYLHTLTPSGQIENNIAVLERHPKGRSALRGRQGFGLYVDLVLEEASQRSVFVNKSRDLFRRTLLEQPHEIPPDGEARWQQFHDHLLQTAKATFEDYIEKVSPLVSRLKGIHTLLNTVMKAKERKPRVLVANNDPADIFDDENLHEQFSKLLAAMNSRNQEEFERAISIVVVPGMDEYYKEKLFEMGLRRGFSAFVSPEEPVAFSDLNEPARLQQLVAEWSHNDNAFYQSGVLCVPDNVVLDRGFRFKLGEYFGSRKTCVYELDSPIAVPACFSAAALVARNDDTRLVKEMLRSNRPSIEERWPCVGLRFGKQKYDPIWIDEALSQGVISEENITQNLPMCIFEHSKDRNGNLNRQRIRQLNTLLTIDNRPVPVHEYRAGCYINRVLRLNYPKGAMEEKLKIFCQNKQGIYREGYDNSILDGLEYDLNFNKDGGSIRISFKGDDSYITEFPVELVGIVQQT